MRADIRLTNHEEPAGNLLPREDVRKPLGQKLAERRADHRRRKTFILYRRPDGRGLYDIIIAACSEASFGPQVGQDAPRIVSTLNLVAAGLGITIVPASLSRLPPEGVRYRPLVGKPALEVPLNLACRADERSAATLAFVDLVRRMA